MNKCVCFPVAVCIPNSTSNSHCIPSSYTDDCLMKRDRSNVGTNRGDSGSTRSSRVMKKKRSSSAVIICPDDKAGPRISAVLEEFARTCYVPSHMDWLYHLEASCAQQGCYVSDCRGRGNFSEVHGAKTLVNSITMFLSYYVPSHFLISSDDEWRELLVALRTFHMFCVRRQYVREDEVLMSALYKLRRFNLCDIPQRITKLCEEKYWDSLETAREEDGPADKDEDGYQCYFGGEDINLIVDQVMPNGWVVACDDDLDNLSPGENQVFLQLPSETSKLGMKGMSLSCLQLGLRNGVWRPVEQEGEYIASAYPPDELFYY